MGDRERPGIAQSVQYVRVSQRAFQRLGVRDGSEDEERTPLTGGEVGHGSLVSAGQSFALKNGLIASSKCRWAECGILRFVPQPEAVIYCRASKDRTGAGLSVAEIVDAYPSLTEESVRGALAELAHQKELQPA